MKVKHLDELNFCSATEEKNRDDKVNIYSLYSSVNCSLLKSHSNNDQLYVGLEKCHQMSNGEGGYQKCRVTLKAGVSHLNTQVKLIQKSKKISVLLKLASKLVKIEKKSQSVLLV